MKNFFHYLPYLLSFLILKPIITFIAYPVTFNRITNFALWEKKQGGTESATEPFGFHMEEYFEHHNETFLYSLILVVLVYSIINYKKLTNIDKKKASKKGTKWYEAGWED